MFEEKLEPLLGSSADPVAAGWQLRQLAESVEGQGALLVEEIAGQSDLVSASDPAILGGILRVVHTVVLQAGPEVVSKVNPDHLQKIMEVCTRDGIQIWKVQLAASEDPNVVAAREKARGNQ
mgnify:CR=1 FL=1